MRNQIDHEIDTILAATQNLPTKKQKRIQNLQKINYWILGFCIAALTGCCFISLCIAIICETINFFFGTNLGPH